LYQRNFGEAAIFITGSIYNRPKEFAYHDIIQYILEQLEVSELHFSLMGGLNIIERP
jgi:hypothetical protein